jgi:hypothetical protein
MQRLALRRVTNLSNHLIRYPQPSRTMSVNALSANLPTTLKDLVNAVVDEQNHLGKSDAEQKEVKDWISKASNADFVSASSLPVRVFIANDGFR